MEILGNETHEGSNKASASAQVKAPGPRTWTGRLLAVALGALLGAGGVYLVMRARPERGGISAARGPVATSPLAVPIAAAASVAAIGTARGDVATGPRAAEIPPRSGRARMTR